MKAKVLTLEKVKDRKIVPGLIDRLVSRKIKLDGYPIEAILDTGAVTSIISEGMVEKILRCKPKSDWKIYKAEEAKDAYDIIAAGGNSLKVLDVVKIPVQYGAFPSKLEKFMVTEGSDEDVLIGTNIMRGKAQWIEAVRLALGSDLEVKEVGVQSPKAAVNSVKGDSMREQAEGDKSIDMELEGLMKRWETIVPPKSEVSEGKAEPNHLFGERVNGKKRKRKVVSKVVQMSRTCNEDSSKVSYLEQSDDRQKDTSHGNGSKVSNLKQDDHVNLTGSKVRICQQVIIEARSSKLVRIQVPWNGCILIESKIVEVLPGVVRPSRFKNTAWIRIVNRKDRDQILMRNQIVGEAFKVLEVLGMHCLIPEKESNPPVVFVKKEDGSGGMCIDYRKSNVVTNRGSYQLPNRAVRVPGSRVPDSRIPEGFSGNPGPDRIPEFLSGNPGFAAD